MAFIRKDFSLSSIAALSLNMAACGQPIEADYCVGIMNDESGAIEPDDNVFIVKTIDEVLLPLGYEKSDSPALVEYKKKPPEYSVIDIVRNLGPVGTSIAHFPSSKDNPYMAGRAAIIAAVDSEIRPKYLVRDCEDISPGSTPKLYH